MSAKHLFDVLNMPYPNWAKRRVCYSFAFKNAFAS